MTPKTADPLVRTGLVEAAARLIAHGQSPTIRRLAEEVGTSTMSVYTHFGGIEDLMREVRREGFDRLAAHMSAVASTRDPVADVSSLGWAYCINALTNPDLYRAMLMEAPIDAEHAAVEEATFIPLVAAVQRCIDAGRFLQPDARSCAIQLWTMVHGMVSMAIAGLFTPDEVSEHLTEMARNLYVGFGDNREAAESSLRRARKRMEGRTTLDRSVSIKQSESSQTT